MVSIICWLNIKTDEQSIPQEFCNMAMKKEMNQTSFINDYSSPLVRHLDPYTLCYLSCPLTHSRKSRACYPTWGTHAPTPGLDQAEDVALRRWCSDILEPKQGRDSGGEGHTRYFWPDYWIGNKFWKEFNSPNLFVRRWVLIMSCIYSTVGASYATT